MPRYELREDGHTFDTVECDSAEDALNGIELDRSDYGDDNVTVWTEIHAFNANDPNDSASRTFQMDPDEPSCTGEAHDWQSPHEIVGGIKENPGVWGHGGGITMSECCVNCGCKRFTDTWAQNPINGTQGHTTVSYEPGFYSSELERLAEESAEE